MRYMAKRMVSRTGNTESSGSSFELMSTHSRVRMAALAPSAQSFLQLPCPPPPLPSFRARYMSKRRVVALIAYLTATTSLGGCAADGPAAGPLVVRRDTVGDTIIVQTVSGSLWGRPLSYREDLRIGALEGSEVETFGEITEVAVGSDRSILVFDHQVPVLRKFDSSGTYLRDFGRRGQGPGEYVRGVSGLAVQRDGQVLLRDRGNGRINRYSENGDLVDAIRDVAGGFSASHAAMIVDTTGHIYVKALMVDLFAMRREQGPNFHLPSPWPVGLIHLTRSGELVDTIPPPEIRGAAESLVWGLHPYGHMLVGSNSTYAFEIRRQDGGIIRVSLPYSPVPFSDAGLAESAELRAARIADGKAADGSDEERPEFRPAYNGFYFGSDGRIWVSRHIVDEMSSTASPSRFFQPIGFDVFEEDGTYLGFARFPANARPMVFTSTHVYAVETGEYDEQYLVRYLLAG